MDTIGVSMKIGAAIGTLVGFTALSPLVMGGIAAVTLTSVFLYFCFNSNKSISNPKAAFCGVCAGFGIGIGLAAAAVAILPSESLAGALIAGALIPLSLIAIDAVEHFSSKGQEI